MNLRSALYAWLLVVLTAAPAVGMAMGAERDGYPFSTYPMFSSPRPRLERRWYVVAVDAVGQERFVPSTFWKKGHFNEGWSAVTRAGRGNAEARAALCEKTARNLGRTTARRWRGVERVELRVGNFDTTDMFVAGSREPVRFRVLAACEIP
jgi:hypothetical protein